MYTIIEFKTSLNYNEIISFIFFILILTNPIPIQLINICQIYTFLD
jgi:hypothetical protein